MALRTGPAVEGCRLDSSLLFCKTIGTTRTVGNAPDVPTPQLCKVFWMRSLDDPVPVAQAAQRLRVTPQTVRNWLRAGRLEGTKHGTRWFVERASIELLEPNDGEPDAPIREIENRINEIAKSLEQLLSQESHASRLLAAIERERDHYRAEAAASKEAALRVNAAANEIDGAVRGLLKVLELQTGALEQLLAPSSPQDLLA